MRVSIVTPVLNALLPTAPRPRSPCLLICLAVVVCILTLTAENGPFTVDDNNYISTLVALRSGGWSLPGTEGQPASWEWYAFDPFPEIRGAPSTPVMTTAPPWWAVLALPFSVLGFKGLVLLNALSFALCLLCVHRLTQLHARSARTPVVAVVALGLGTFAIEYAQSVWPHMVSMGLVSAAIYFAARARLDASPRLAALAGFIVGVAAGVRYQNVVVALAVGLGLIFAQRARVKLTAAFVLALCVPLIAAAVVNWHRIGVLNPVSKGSGYANLAAFAPGPPATSRIQSIAMSFYTRVIDFSPHGPIADGSGRVLWEADPDLGVFIAVGAIKKALLQSVPWMALALCLLAAAWWPTSQLTPQRTELRALALTPFALLALFSAAGTGQHDGFCFNQRYFFEAMPAAAVAIAWWEESLESTGRRPALFGALLGLLVAMPLVIGDPGSDLRTLCVRFAGLVLAAALLVVGLSGAKRRFGSTMLAACIGFALALHLSEDLPASRRIKHSNAVRMAMMRETVPLHSAIFTWAGARDGLFPLTWLADIWVLDPWLDAGKDAPMLVRNALANGRRVFLDEALPPEVRSRLLQTLKLQIRPAGAGLMEVLADPPQPELK